MQNLLRFQKPLAILALAAAMAGAIGYFTRSHWLPRFVPGRPEVAGDSSSQGNESASPLAKVLLSDQAIANLRLQAKAVQPQSFWKTIQVPGMVVESPGRSDRNIVSPAMGTIASIKHLPGSTVRPGEVLFTIRLLSESLHQTQSELFKATQDIKLAQAQRKRLGDAGDAIPGARLIEIDHQIARIQVTVETCRQELINRSFTAEQIDRVAEGKFVTEIAIQAPDLPADGIIKSSGPMFEVQELKVELGEQVQAGQTLCLLAYHQMLAIEGRAFRDETPLLERSVKQGWPVDVDFQEVAEGGWPPLEQTFQICHLANTIDPVSRTFAFLMPLENQSRIVETGGRTQMLWRFRPGQKVRLLVRVEKLDNVFILPAEAVAREGAEAFVFTQNVNTFERTPVRIVYQDHRSAVLANDGSLLPGSFVVQNVAAQLDRMAKSQSSSVPKGYHIHADGSLHKNEDEAK